MKKIVMYVLLVFLSFGCSKKEDISPIEVEMILVRVYPAGLPNTHVQYEVTAKVENAKPEQVKAFRLHFYDGEDVKTWEMVSNTTTHKFTFPLVIGNPTNPRKVGVDVEVNGQIYSTPQPEIIPVRGEYQKNLLGQSAHQFSSS